MSTITGCLYFQTGTTVISIDDIIAGIGKAVVPYSIKRMWDSLSLSSYAGSNTVSQLLAFYG